MAAMTVPFGGGVVHMFSSCDAGTDDCNQYYGVHGG